MQPRLHLVFLLLAANVALAAEPVVITSSSRQITVRGQRLGHIKAQPPAGSGLVLLDPSLLAVTGDTVRQTLDHELGWGAEWRGRVFIDLHPVRFEQEPILIHAVRSPDGWSYRLEMPDEVEASRLVRALVEVLLMEYSNRAARQRAAEFPPWLVPGLAAYMQAGPLDALVLAPNRPLVRTRVQADPLGMVRARLQTNAPLTVDQLNWPAEDQFEGARADQYEACAHLMVRELLRLRGGPDCLREMLASLPAHLNWQTSFLNAFRPHFQRLLDFEKWWSLLLVNFAGRDPDQTWTRAESLQRLDEILFTPVQVRLEADDLPHESQLSLQAILTEWEDAQRLPLLRQKAAQLQAAQPHLASEVASVAGAYRTALVRFLQAQEQPAATAAAQARAGSRTRAIVNDTLAALKALDTKRQKLWSEPPPSTRAAKPNPPRAPAKADNPVLRPTKRW